MDLEALRAFLAVVETGSFVSAATTRRIARATLRRRVDELEAQAGVPLLVRTGHGATPTEAGRVLAERGRRILAEANALLASVREIGGEPAGTLRVGLPVGMPPTLIAPLYGMLRARFPKLTLQVRFAEDPVAGLLRDVDVALGFGDPPDEGPFTIIPVHTVRERLVASRTYLERRGPIDTLEGLAGHDVFVWETPGADASRLPLVQGGMLSVMPALRSADIHLVRRCAAEGFGVAFVPHDGLPDERNDVSSDLVPVLADRVGRDRVARVVLPDALADIPRVRILVDLARGFFVG